MGGVLLKCKYELGDITDECLIHYMNGLFADVCTHQRAFASVDTGSADVHIHQISLPAAIALSVLSSC